MKMYEFSKKISELGLSLCWSNDKEILSVGNPEFANPIVWFNPYLEEKDYDGSVRVKSINAPLFTDKQIKGVLLLVDEFLLTQLEDRMM